MISKGFLLVIVSLIWTSTVLATCDLYQKEKVFICPGDDPQLVNIYGMDFKCEAAFMCNYVYKPDNTTCSPCVAMAKICGATYQCVNQTHFKMGESELKCPKDTECNKEKLTTCAPCVGYCNPDLWECDPDDDKKVTIGGMVVRCNGKEICNKDKTPPCNACILPKRDWNNFPMWHSDDSL